jgi:hypothetical protein
LPLLPLLLLPLLLLLLLLLCPVPCGVCSACGSGLVLLDVGLSILSVILYIVGTYYPNPVSCKELQRLRPHASYIVA